MGYDLRRAVFAVGLLSVLLGLPSRQSHAAPSGTTGHLGTALAATLAGSGSIAFTDWLLLKRYEGVPALTSASPDAERVHFMLSLDRDQAAFSAYGAAFFVGHVATWSWDSTDLVWEAGSAIAKSPQVYVLKFRDDFDFAPLIAHFVKRGFSKSNYHGVSIYSHALDLSADWLTTTEFSILNTAIVESRKLLVLSSSLDAVRAYLDAERAATTSLARDPAIQAAAARLGTVASATLYTGAAACGRFNLTTMLAQRVLANTPLPAELRPLKRVHPFAALALGYRREGKHPLGILVLHYTDPANARADLAIRRKVAMDGASLVARQPYSTLFTVQDALVAGTDIVMRLQPAHNRPIPFVQMVQSNDLSFAVC